MLKESIDKKFECSWPLKQLPLQNKYELIFFFFFCGGAALSNPFQEMVMLRLSTQNFSNKLVLFKWWGGGHRQNQTQPL